MITEEILLRQIKDNPNQRALDYTVIDHISLSQKIDGQLSPIIVFRLPTMTRQFQVVSGGHRLEAARRNGWASMKCLVVDSNANAEAVSIAENAFRNELSALEKATQICRHVAIHNLDSRRSSINSYFSGKTASAAKKAFERAKKINALDEKSRELIVSAGLANNQRALLAIASEKEPKRRKEIIDKFGGSARRFKAHGSEAARTKKSSCTQATDILETVFEFSKTDRSDFKELRRAWKASSSFRAAWKLATELSKARFADEILGLVSDSC